MPDILGSLRLSPPTPNPAPVDESQLRDAGVEMLKRGASREQVSKFVDEYRQQHQQKPMMNRFMEANPKTAATVRMGTSLLPGVGAIAGGALGMAPAALSTPAGAPFVEAGAVGLGAAAGKGAQDLANEYLGLQKQTTPMQKAGAIGKEAVISGAVAGVLPGLNEARKAPIQTAKEGFGAVSELVPPSVRRYLPNIPKMFRRMTPSSEAPTLKRPAWQTEAGASSAPTAGVPAAAKGPTPSSAATTEAAPAAARGAAKSSAPPAAESTPKPSVKVARAEPRAAVKNVKVAESNPGVDELESLQRDAYGEPSPTAPNGGKARGATARTPATASTGSAIPPEALTAHGHLAEGWRFAEVGPKGEIFRSFTDESQMAAYTPVKGRTVVLRAPDGRTFPVPHE